MSKSNYSAGKRRREQDKQRKKREKTERQRERRETGMAGIPIATVDEIQGGLMSIDEVVRGLATPVEAGERSVSHPSRLFIGGLSSSVTADDMQKKLQEFGPVVDAIVVMDRDTGDSRGFGFVTMADRRDAAKAIRDLDGQDQWGRTLVVRQATDRGR